LQKGGFGSGAAERRIAVERPARKRAVEAGL